MPRMRMLRRLGTTLALAAAIVVGVAGCVVVPYGGGRGAYGGDHDRYEHHEYAHHDRDGWGYDGRRG